MTTSISLQQAENCKWLIKYGGSNKFKDIEKFKQLCLDDNSIGIHYNIIQPLYGLDIESISKEIKCNYKTI